MKKAFYYVTYVFIGALTSILNVGIFYLANQLLSWNFFISNNIAWGLSVLFAYFANKTIVFSSPYTTVKNTLLEMISFFSSRLLTLIMQDMLLYVGISLLNIRSIIAKLASEIIVITLNYFLSRWIFQFNKRRH